jgi:hypothetical protein
VQDHQRGLKVVAYFETDWRPSNALRSELVRIGLSEAVISSIVAELIDLRSRWEDKLSTRRQRLSDSAKLKEHLSALLGVLRNTNELTISDVESLARAFTDFGRDGKARTHIQFRDFTHAIEAYVVAADKVIDRLKAGGPDGGKDPEQERDVVWQVGRIFSSNGLETSNSETGQLVRTLGAIFDAMGLIQGEPRKHVGKLFGQSGE